MGIGSYHNIKFPPFNAYVCPGDSVTVEHQGFTIRAHIERDDCGDTPEDRQDGFWPSLDPKDAGYIGPKSKATLAKHMAKARAVLKAWQEDEWFYCGVCVTVSRAGVELTGRYDHALWGVECNYPSKQGNAYLSEVAGEQANEALAAANAKLDELLASLTEV